MNPHSFPIPTTDGPFLACFSDRGLARLGFPPARPGPETPPPAEEAQPMPLRAWLRLTERALAAVLAGRAPAELPPLDLSDGTEFQRAVWAALQRIPRGETRSYAQVAAALGRPRAARAVGQACGANPIPVLIPCHRVRAADGGLGGFSGGLGWKRKLLEREAGA